MGYMQNISSICLCVGLLNCVSATGESYSPNENLSYPQNVYWGDTHVHTRNSSDSVFYGGNNKLTIAQLEIICFPSQ